MIQTCYIFTLSDDTSSKQYCTMSRALGGNSACLETSTNSGSDPSLLGLITCGMFFIMHLVATGFSACIARRPDAAKQFAVIAVVLTGLSSIALGLSSYSWATAFGSTYFSDPHTWCVLDGELGTDFHNMTTTCGEADIACRRQVNWGYSSFILWLALGCSIGVLVCTLAETYTVFTTTHFNVEDAFISKQEDRAAAISANESTPLLINDGDGPTESGADVAPASDADLALL